MLWTAASIRSSSSTRLGGALAITIKRRRACLSLRRSDCAAAFFAGAPGAGLPRPAGAFSGYVTPTLSTTTAGATLASRLRRVYADLGARTDAFPNSMSKLYRRGYRVSAPPAGDADRASDRRWQTVFHHAAGPGDSRYGSHEVAAVRCSTLEGNLYLPQLSPAPCRLQPRPTSALRAPQRLSVSSTMLSDRVRVIPPISVVPAGAAAGCSSTDRDHRRQTFPAAPCRRRPRPNGWAA